MLVSSLEGLIFNFSEHLIQPETSMEATWEEIKNRIKSGISQNPFSLWIDPIIFLGEKGNTVTLGCPNKFSCNWVKEHYMGLIQEELLKAGGSSHDVILKVAPKKKEMPSSPPRWESDQLMLPHLPEKKRRGKLRLNTDFTFDRFVVGDCNEFAYSASKALARSGSWNYHSLLMLAHTGLGKSHLSQAAGHAVLEGNADSRVYYLTAEDFTNEMISSLKNNSIEGFKDKYRRCCDVLIMEEVHFLSGKEKIQAELGYTLDALANDNKKIIFTSSLSPKDIPRMSKELSSRLGSGLVTNITSPDYETRVKILKNKASEHNIVLSENIIGLLASRLNRDIRQMESAVKCLKARSELLKMKVDLNLAEEVVNSLVPRVPRIGLEDIKELVCKYYKVEPEIFRSKSRKKIHTYPRNIYVYLCRRFTEKTLEKIAHTINRSHSTVLYSAELIERKMKTNSAMRREVEFLGRQIENRSSAGAPIT